MSLSLFNPVAQDSLACLCQTANSQELAVALAEPGVIFWQDINALPRDRFNRA